MTQYVLKIGRPPQVRGLICGIAALLLWGASPLYWHLLRAVPAPAIICHRIISSAVLTFGIVAVRREIPSLWPLLSSTRVMAYLAVTASLITANWLTYNWAVNNGHVLESSLGYYIAPLLTSILGIALFKDRINKPQMIGIAITAAGLLYTLNDYARLPLAAIGIAASFSFYSVVRKRANVNPLHSFCIEALLLTPFALAYIFYRASIGTDAFFGGTPSMRLLLMGGSLLTAIPLILYVEAVVSLSMVEVGFLQYINPTVQYLVGRWAFHEPVNVHTEITFGIIWIGIAVFLEGLRRTRVKMTAQLASLSTARH